MKKSKIKNRITNFINSHNHRLIGWNEILNDSLSNNVICQFWKGDYEELLKKIRKGRDVIFSEERKLYLDFPYSLTNLKDTFSVRLDSFLRRLELHNINFASKDENNGEIECGRSLW
jgi:N-acetyl-beta-hexosaminidase